MMDVAFFTAVIMVFLRLIGFFTVTPVFFPKGTPAILKVAFTLILSYMLVPGIDYSQISNINNTMVFITNCSSKIITGLALGFMTQLCFMAIRLGGNYMDIQVGFSMVSMLDPNTSSNSTLIERLLYWTGLILFFMVDGHHMLITQLIDSFNAVTIGRFILNQETASIIIEVFIQFFIMGLKIAIPIVLIIIIAELTLGLVGRAVPQLNVMILGLPLKIIVGLATLILAMPIIFKLIATGFSNIPEAFKGFFRGVPPILFIFASEDKTEEATPHKLQEARKKGQVAKSKEVGLAFTLLMSTLVISFLGQYAIENLQNVMTAFLKDFMGMELNYKNLFYISLTIVMRSALIILPLIIPIMIMGIFANFIQTGFIFTKETLKPDIKKLNPVNGFKKIFSTRTLVELVKDLALVNVVGYVGYRFLKKNYIEILNLNNLRFPIMLKAFKGIAVKAFFNITLVMIFIAVGDFIFQKKKYKKDMKMSKQEVKEEFKQQEGDPQIKGKIRQKQREMAMRRMMQSVPDATVVITNPTHIAVALKYEEGKGQAPMLVAKGADYVAYKIKEKAKESKVPIIENRPLARMIYEKVELEEEIPVEMYEAVAEILAFVFKFNK
ncbi:fused FliR family export protein/FlhB family type III secretion system protein [Clostridium tetani]|uniref:fused FliR family export protein/FlhB family type III secretion system protein n=1 Tax=Clostridium tetani TaxID=1513 RepID=UPI0013E95388|nr:fused FliR family export protein/FlhB family type III secretion system protein [Clostridium tetani]